MPDSNGLTILDDLPDAVIFGEILVRLPAKDVFRCRAVHKSWRCGTSNSNFLTDHHHRQPKLPIINFLTGDCDSATHLRRHVVYPNAGIDIANRKLVDVLPHEEAERLVVLHAAHDGLLLISSTTHQGSFCVYNPATQQRTHTPQLARYSSGIRIAGFYQHHASGEYRVLYWNHFIDVYCILALGSDEPPRHIRYPLVFSFSFREALLKDLLAISLAPVLHRNNLHWYDSDIVVFCTATEMFRRMRGPALESHTPTACLLEMEGMLAMCSNVEGLVINIWVMQGYEAEVWESKYLINLMIAVPRLPLRSMGRLFKVVVVNERELLIQFRNGDLKLFDIAGKLIRNTRSEAAEVFLLTPHFLQENITPLPFFEMQDHGANEESPLSTHATCWDMSFVLFLVGCLLVFGQMWYLR